MNDMTQSHQAGTSTRFEVCQQANETRSTWQSIYQRLTSQASIQLAIWIALVAGIALRVSQLATNRSFFLDEAFVATNIFHKDFLGLLKTLEFDQRAPAAFLWAVKACWSLIGQDDWILRLAPFFSGVGSLFVFRSVAAKLLELPFQLIAMLLFALAAPQIFYASDLKQYSTDVLITLCAVNFALSSDGRTSSWSRSLGFGLFGLVAFFFSFISVFCLGAIGLVMLWQDRKSFDMRLVRLAAIFACWGIGFVLIYLVQIRNYDPSPDWKDLWGNAFLRTSLFSVDGAIWLRDCLSHVGSNPVGIAPASIGCLFLIFGFFRLARVSFFRACILIGPVAAALVAAIVGHYPFNGRVILFTAPLIILLMSYGVQEQSKLTHEGTLFLSALAVTLLDDRGTALAIIGISALVVFLWTKMLRWNWLVSPKLFCGVRTVAVCALLLTVPCKEAGKHVQSGTPYLNPLFHKYRLQELKSVMQHVRNNWQDGDKIYLYSMTHVAFGVYADRFGFKPEDWTAGCIAFLPPTMDQIANDFAAHQGKGRLWVLFSHVTQRGEETDSLRYTAYLDTIGTRLDSHQLGDDYDAEAHLYDLSKPSRLVSAQK